MRLHGKDGALHLLAFAALLTAIALPLCVVLPRPAHLVSEYVFEARVDERLGISTNGQLTYLAASTLNGDAPADDVVLSLDENYTRGWEPAKVDTGAAYWFEGSLMTPQVYFGEQYIFYGPPQLYLRQMKTGALWPDQQTELRMLYLSPLSTLAAPIQLPLLFRSDSLSTRIVSVFLLRCLLLAATAFWTVRHGDNRSHLLLGLAVYALLAVALSVPILGDLY